MKTKLKNIKNKIFKALKSSAKDLKQILSPTLKLNIINYFKSNPLRIFIALIFSALFLPHAFIMTQDINLISAYEVDPGSIISSIEDLFKQPFYNMLKGYHSKFYGWTFMAINFFILIPIKIFTTILGIKNGFLFYFTIRLTLFFIGLISTLLLFEVLSKLSKNKTLILFITALYITIPVFSKFFYFIHPESTGALFTFLAIIFLLKFIEKPDSKSYIPALISLGLASLSKQVFFLSSLPILFCFFHFYCKNNNKSYINFISSREFLKILKITTLISLATLFIIHPYSFFKFSKFFLYQIELSKSFSSIVEISFYDNLNKWINTLKHNPLITFSLATTPFVASYSLYLYHKTKNPKSFLVGINAIAAIYLFIMIADTNKAVIALRYLYPCYIFLILNIFAIFSYLTTLKSPILKTSFNIVLIYVAILSTVHYGKISISESQKRLEYKSTIAYKTYNYIKKNLTSKDKIAHDHMVAVPFSMNSASCHYWRGCGSGDYIEEFNPNYIMFDKNFRFITPESKPTQRLQKYVKDHKMVLIGKITKSKENLITGQDMKNYDSGIAIYKKIKR